MASSCCGVTFTPAPRQRGSILFLILSCLFQFDQPQYLFCESNCCPHSVPLALAKTRGRGSAERKKTKQEHINSKITTHPLKPWRWWIRCQAKSTSLADRWIQCMQNISPAAVSLFFWGCCCCCCCCCFILGTFNFWYHVRGLCLPHTAQCIWYKLNSFSG